MKATSLIVAGTPFSGAVLLGHALGAHPQAFFAGESWRHWDRGADPGARACGSCGGGCAAWNDPAVASAVANGPAAMSAALAATTGRRVVIEGPASASWLEARLADGETSGEDARVVVCVCDPLLYVRKRARVTTEELAMQRAAEWRDEQQGLVRTALSSGRPLLVVRYEDLADRTDETLARVCAFAGLESGRPPREGRGVPTHAIGAKSEAWGVATPVDADSAQAAPGDPRQHRVETLSTHDRDPGVALGADVVYRVFVELRPTGLYEMFGYRPALPPYRAPRDDAERQGMVEWVKEELRHARAAVLDDRANAAIARLRMLVDHFGPAFDDLGLELTHEQLAIVLVDLLNSQQRGTEALPYARALAGHTPRNPEARRLLAVANASVPATLEAHGRRVRESGAAGTVPGSLSRDVADLLVAVDADEPAKPAFLAALADHARLAAAVDATLVSRLQGGDRAEAVHTALDEVRAARGLPLPSAAPPEYLLIALTNHCNYRCFFCCAEKERADPALADLPIERFFSLRSAIETAGVVDLTSPGEALLYPHVREAMAFVAEHNRNRGFQLTTTGALLTEDMILPVASRIDQVTVSLNAATPETYARDMRSRLWERVLENLRSARRLLGRDRITLGFVAHGDNIHELPALVRLAAELDVWHIRIAPFSVNRPELVRRSLWFCKEKTQALIGEARRIGEAEGIIVSNIYESVLQMSSAIGSRCVFPRWGSYIGVDGDVAACCYTRLHPMGNVHRDGGFEAIWNGRKYRALRKRLHFRECRECPNTFKDMERLDSHIVTEAIPGARALLPAISVVVQAPASAEQVQAAVSSLKGQTYSVWEAVILLDEGCPPVVRRAAEEAARADSRIQCVSSGSGADPARARSAPGRPRGDLSCRMDPAQPFQPNELELQLRACDCVGSGG